MEGRWVMNWGLDLLDIDQETCQDLRRFSP